MAEGPRATSSRSPARWPKPGTTSRRRCAPMTSSTADSRPTIAFDSFPSSSGAVATCARSATSYESRGAVRPRLDRRSIQGRVLGSRHRGESGRRSTRAVLAPRSAHPPVDAQPAHAPRARSDRAIELPAAAQDRAGPSRPRACSCCRIRSTSTASGLIPRCERACVRRLAFATTTCCSATSDASSLRRAWRRLAHALNQAMSEDSRLHALWVGHGKSEQALRDLTTLGGSPTHHHWSPWLDDVRPAYAAMDMLALPSEGSETFGRVLVEAQAYGLPVLGCAERRHSGSARGRRDRPALAQRDVAEAGRRRSRISRATTIDVVALPRAARDFALRFDEPSHRRGILRLSRQSLKPGGVHARPADTRVRAGYTRTTSRRRLRRDSATSQAARNSSAHASDAAFGESPRVSELVNRPLVGPEPARPR